MKHFDIAVIGSGPAGQKAAIQAAKAGRKVAMIERDRLVGGSCVHRGTIPSKTLRATALQIRQLRECSDFAYVDIAPNMEVAALMSRLENVTSSHAEVMNAQLCRNQVELITGDASFVDAHTLNVQLVRKPAIQISAEFIVVATGSRPRRPPEIPIDHEHILDSDSILSMLYLPKSLAVLGAGVIASEYASIFAALGTEVTMIDGGPRPVGFMDKELSESFVAEFESSGGRYISQNKPVDCQWDEVSSCVTTLADGTEIRSEKVLCALGRLANVDGLNLEALGVELTKRGQIAVDSNCLSSVPNIYAVGDVIGYPALASTSMEQGRRAACHALGLKQGREAMFTPVGIYTIPEMSGVGLSEEEAVEQFGGCTVGRASFEEVSRGQISGSGHGLLKLVADKEGDKLLGAHIIGQGACELIHVAQAALISQWSIEAFVEHIFNFPTLAEAYRIAALDLINRGRKSKECDDENLSESTVEALKAAAS